MSKKEETNISVEEAQKVLIEAEQTKMEAFRKEFDALCQKYGFSLTASFNLFGSEVNPPIRLYKLPPKQE